MRRLFIIFGLAAVVACAAVPTSAQRVRVEVENLQPSDGFFITPVWVGFHNGGFDLFDSGATASAGLELLAEEGDFSALSTEFAGSGTDGAVFGHDGFPGAPVIDPGELTSAVFDIGPNDRYFSFASMVIPSNDAFIGNGDALAYELFDTNGVFNGPLTINIVGGNIYDAGSEVNDGQGAAFSATGGTSTDEDGTVGLHPGLQNFLDTQTVAGTTIGSIPGSNTPFARITITAVPEPATFGVLIGLAGMAVIRRKR